ncbi:MAG: hypothetical protein AUH86_14425 [Acidobacteria bacterium 13_1_40CM_4_58_4]|nr:MAG: hypothetical protein AUH86_14425 [Acidobacteria bacterium 13_1_40CM_4_58_4]
MSVKRSNLPEYDAKMSGGRDHVLALTSALASSGRLGVGPASLATRYVTLVGKHIDKQSGEDISE